jgi:hypothetical protein
MQSKDEPASDAASGCYCCVDAVACRCRALFPLFAPGDRRRRRLQILRCHPVAIEKRELYARRLANQLLMMTAAKIAGRVMGL